MTIEELIKELRHLPEHYVVRDTDGSEVEHVFIDDDYEEVSLEI